MQPRLIAGQANLSLAQSVAHGMNVELVRRTILRFPDGALHVELEETVRGDDVYVIQPTGPSIPGPARRGAFVSRYERANGSSTANFQLPSDCRQTEKLAAMIPQPRINLLIYHGAFAPAARF